MGTQQPVSVYIHVPFCTSKCSYCDFTSSPHAEQALASEGVMWEVRRRAEEFATSEGRSATRADAFCEAVPFFLDEFASRGVLNDVPSIYVGGGTPTVLGAQLPRLVERLCALCTLAQDAEVTIEANPESTSGQLIRDLISAGANRFSLGVQSFDDEVLSILGRCHDAETARRAVGIVAASGARFSVDLMCGIPGQSMESWRASVEEAIATGTGHVSVYPLSIEPGTTLYHRMDIGDLAEPDPDSAAEMMLMAESMLGSAGIRRYEVASYARPGEESRHNTGYWTGHPYLGVGPSAASMMPVPIAHETPVVHYVRTWPEDWRVRFVMNDTLGSFLGYLWDRQPAVLEPLTPTESAREDAMLGLRMTIGIADELAQQAGVVDVLTSLAEENLVEHAEGRWRTTSSGWLLGNEVFARVWAGE